MARHGFFSFLFAFSLVLAFLATPAQGQAAAWLDDVDPLITAREREVFLRLTTDADRQAFIQRFWQARDPYPETVRNEARERWEARLAEARRRWSDGRDERFRILLVNGEPGFVIEAQCAGEPLEAWIYEPRFQVKYQTVLVFTGGGSGPAHLWHPGDAPDLRSPSCANDPKLANLVTWIRLAGNDGYEAIAKRALSAPKPREWVSGFKLPSASAGETTRRERPSLAARLAVDFPGRIGDGIVRVLVEPLTSPDALPDDTVHAPSDKRELILTGQVLRGERRSNAPCQPRVYLDGTPLMLSKEITINEVIAPDQVEAVEFYRGPSETPDRFAYGDTSCGVIVIWSRSGGSRDGS